MAELMNETSGSFDFISTFDGKLVQRVPDGTEGAHERALTAGANEGKMVWEKTYTSVSGLIMAGEIAVKEFGHKKVKEIQIQLDDNILLQLPMNMLSAFAKPLPNVDITKPVKVSVYKNKRGKAGLNISQEAPGGEWVQAEWAYTKEEPNGLPQPTQDDLGDWDFRDHDTYLVKKVGEFFCGVVDVAPVAKPASLETLVPEPVEETPIPF
jgi:hypothetical protein